MTCGHTNTRQLNVRSIHHFFRPRAHHIVYPFRSGVHRGAVRAPTGASTSIKALEQSTQRTATASAAVCVRVASRHRRWGSPGEGGGHATGRFTIPRTRCDAIPTPGAALERPPPTPRRTFIRLRPATTGVSRRPYNGR